MAGFHLQRLEGDETQPVLGSSTHWPVERFAALGLRLSSLDALRGLLRRLRLDPGDRTEPGRSLDFREKRVPLGGPQAHRCRRVLPKYRPGVLHAVEALLHAVAGQS